MVKLLLLSDSFQYIPTLLQLSSLLFVHVNHPKKRCSSAAQTPSTSVVTLRMACESTLHSLDVFSYKDVGRRFPLILARMTPRSR